MPITNQDRSKIDPQTRLSISRASADISRGIGIAQTAQTVSAASDIISAGNSLMSPPADNNISQLTMEQVRSEFYINDAQSQLDAILSHDDVGSQLGGGLNDVLSSSGGFSFGSLDAPTSLQITGNGTLIDILKSTNPKTVDNNEFKFKVFIQFDGYDKNFYDDTLMLLVMRLGFFKYAAIYYLRINLTPVLVEQIKLEQNANRPVGLKLFLYTIKTDGSIDLKNPILERPLVMRTLETKTNAEIERGNTVMCDMILSSKVAKAMNDSYTYNKVLNSKTAYDVLLDYEQAMTATYGDNFESKHILANKNEHIYEQILTKPTDQDVRLPNNAQFSQFSKSDVGIPDFLNSKYKVDNSLSFYFYDSFNVKSKKEFVRYFISLGDKNKFEKFKIEGYEDITKQSQFSKSYPFADHNSTISQENPVVTGKQINASYDTEKKQVSKSEKGNTQTGQKINVVNGSDENRFFYSQRTTSTKQETANSSGSTSYTVPDSQTNSNQRVEAAKNLFSKGIDRIDEFSTNNCGIDWLQFGVLYPLNLNRPNEFLHTPVSIVNIIRRENAKENVLTHMIRFMAVKFVSDDAQQRDGESDKSTQQQGKQNKNAKAAKTATTKKAAEEKPKTETPAAEQVEDKKEDYVEGGRVFSFDDLQEYNAERPTGTPISNAPPHYQKVEYDPDDPMFSD